MVIEVKSPISKTFSVAHAINDNFISSKNLLNIKQNEITIQNLILESYISTSCPMDNVLLHINFPHKLCLDYLSENRHCVVQN